MGGVGVDDLYGLPLDQFIPERTALCARAAQGRRARTGERGRGAAKPSVAAWAVNQLVRTQRKAIHELLEAGDGLRSAQDDVLAGRGDASSLRAAVERERLRCDTLSDAARGLLSSEGARAERDDHRARRRHVACGGARRRGARSRWPRVASSASFATSGSAASGATRDPGPGLDRSGSPGRAAPAAGPRGRGKRPSDTEDERGREEEAGRRARGPGTHGARADEGARGGPPGRARHRARGPAPGRTRGARRQARTRAPGQGRRGAREAEAPGGGRG